MRRMFAVRPRSRRLSWMLLIVGIVNLLVGLVIAFFVFGSSPASAVFSNGANNLLMGFTFGTWGGIGLCSENRSRIIAALRTTYVVSTVFWVIVLCYGFTQLFTGSYWAWS